MLKAGKPSICLAMIVKNEARVIERCLVSLRDTVDHWVICDTGSTDGTQDIVRATMERLNIPGELHDRPWVDFAWNRNEAIQLALPHAAYILTIDADDQLEFSEHFRWPAIESDSVDVEILFDNIVYRRPLMVCAAKPWRYRGVIHEFLDCSVAYTTEHLPGCRLIIGKDGARRSNPHSSSRDIHVLRDAIKAEAEAFLISRYTFYLAQTLRESGFLDEALVRYLERSEQGFWSEEVFYSLLQVARIRERRGDHDDYVISAYSAAAAASNTRAEAWHDLAKFARTRSVPNWSLAFEAAREAIAKAQPPGGLFVEPFVYEIGSLDEFAIAAHYADRHAAAVAACNTLLTSSSLPQHYRGRVHGNLRHSLLAMVSG